MPTYQYRCTECDDSLEVVQKFADDPLTICPSCAGRLRKVFSPVGVVFKGSGFYKTDSRSASKRMDGQRGEGKVNETSAAGSGDGAAASADDSQNGSAADKAKPDGSKSDGSKTEGSKTEGSKTAAAGAGRSNGSAKSGSNGSKTSDGAKGATKESVHKVA